MTITIRELQAGDPDDWLRLDDSFTVDSTLVLSLANGRIGYEIAEVPAFTKRYSDEPAPADEETDFSAYIGNPDQIVYLAYAGARAAGRIILRRNWNRYAYIEDIQVDRLYRRHGIGRMLIERAKRWAAAGGMPGLMLETQSNNVRACRFYESCGFEIGGFDTRLYQGVRKQTDEIALFWYLMFDE